MVDLRSAFDVFLNHYNSMSLGDKYLIAASSRDHLIRAHTSMLKFNGYLFADSHYAVRCDSGEYHVYVWAHLLSGKIFYVGSGIEDRWQCRYRLKNQSFLEHLDQGDAVVYKIIEGVDKDTARFYERYISLSISMAGAELANRDNNVCKCGYPNAKEWLRENADRISDELTSQVEDVLLNKILSGRDFRGTHVLEALTFRQTYGDHWFSQGKFLEGDAG